MSRKIKVLVRLLVFAVVFATATVPVSSMGKDLERASKYEGSIDSSLPDVLKNKTSHFGDDESPVVSKDNIIEVSEDKTAEAPKEETSEAPKEETSEAPKEETSEAPKEETSEAPKEETSEAPKDETTEEPTEVSGDKTTVASKDEDCNLSDAEQDKVSEKGRAEPISKYDILSISGLDSKGRPVIDVFRPQGGLANAFLTTEHQFQREALKIEIRRRGSDGSIFENTPDCDIPTSSPPYDIIKDAYGGMVEWTVKSDIIVTNPDVSELHIQYNIVSPAGGKTRKIIIRLVDSRNVPPETPLIIYNPAYPDSYVLTGTDNTMEYAVTQNSFEKGTFTWTPCTGEDIILTPPKSTTFYLVRYKATSDASESQYKELVLRPRDAAPGISYDETKEIIKGLTTDMEYSINDGTYTAVTEEFVSGDMSCIIDGIKDTDSQVINVRIRANGKPASLERSITLYKRLNPPTGVNLDTVNLILTGTKSGMQYKVDTEDSWHSIVGANVDLQGIVSSEKNVSIQVRYSRTATNSHSNSITILIPRLTNAPANLSVNYQTETMIGFDVTKKYQYSTSLTGKYIPITLGDGEFLLRNVISHSPKILYIREAATADKPHSAVTQIQIPARRKVPGNVVFVYNDPNTAETQAILKNVSTEMEYKKSNEITWQTFSGDTMVFDVPKAVLYYNVRLAATTMDFASDIVSIPLQAYRGTPGCSLSLTSEIISKLNNQMEYRVNGGSYTPVGEMKSMPVGNIADSLPEGGSYVMDFRLMRNERDPMGKVQTITIYPRPKAPQNLSYNVSTYILSGVTPQMQYREVGKTYWATINQSTVNLQTLVNGQTDVQIEVRYSTSDNKIFASYPTIVNLY